MTATPIDYASRFNTTLKRLTPESLNQYGCAKEMVLPQVSFDPAGTWKQSWRIWAAAGWNQDRGYFTMERIPGTDGKRTGLKIHRELFHRIQFANEITDITMECESDAWGTPRQWRMGFRIEDMVEGGAFQDAASDQQGLCASGRLTRAIGGKESHCSVTAPFTTNWSLMAALQSARQDNPPNDMFTLLDECDKVKPEQRLFFRGKREIPFGKETVDAACVVQVGRGGLPVEFYFDPSGHLLLLLSGMLACYLDEQAPARHAKSIAWHGPKAVEHKMIVDQMRWKEQR